jgi:hypothetical protein
MSRRPFDELKFFSFFTDAFWRADMPKLARVAATISAASVSSPKSEGHPLISIALFCGVGLLATLVAIHVGLQLTSY